MKPQFFQVLGTELVVKWDDGHESYYPLELLRRNCPCAYCSGEPDLFGRIAKGPEQHLTERSFRVRDIQTMGNYGLQPNWEDGHAWGIWTFDRLRAFCPCDECAKNNDSNEGEKPQTT